jgi:hypothetical protein
VPALLLDESDSGFKSGAEVICFLRIEFNDETTAAFEWNSHNE